MPTYQFRGEIRRVITVYVEALSAEEALRIVQADNFITDDYEESNCEELIVFHDDELPEEI